jgi:putative ABC transport system substrate-binding protein
MVMGFRRREFISALGSSAVAWPLTARAQQGGKIPRIGYLWHAGNAEQEGPYFKALNEGFERLGYFDGRNIKLEHRFPNETAELFKSMAAELVASNVDILMGGNTASIYLKQATSTIPIVFMFVVDPVGLKLVDSLAHPGGNATGLSSFSRDLVGKRLQLLKEAVPGLSRVALLVNPNESTSKIFIGEFRTAATQLGVTLRVFEARSLGQIEPAFDEMAKADMQAVNVTNGGLSFQARAITPKLAISRRLALCAYSKETFEFGALMSYGPNQIEMCRRSAVYADKILHGAKPGEIPVEQPTKLDFLINLTTAKALGLTIPATLLTMADEVIE